MRAVHEWVASVNHIQTVLAVLRPHPLGLTFGQLRAHFPQKEHAKLAIALNDLLSEEMLLFVDDTKYRINGVSA